MLIILNLPLIGMWIKLLTVPYRWLFPAIVLFCAIGVFTTNNNTFDIWMVAGFGFIGYMFNKLGMEPAPLLLGFILGPMMEENLRRALLLSRGDWSVLVTRPLSLGLLIAARHAAVDRAAAGGEVQTRRGVCGGLGGRAGCLPGGTLAGAVFVSAWIMPLHCRPEPMETLMKQLFAAGLLALATGLAGAQDVVAPNANLKTDGIPRWKVHRRQGGPVHRLPRL